MVSVLVCVWVGRWWRGRGRRRDKKTNPSPNPTQPPATPDRIEGMPLTDVLLVNVKLLTLDELATITARGAEGRAALDASFAGRDRLVSSLARGSMV